MNSQMDSPTGYQRSLSTRPADRLARWGRRLFRWLAAGARRLRADPGLRWTLVTAPCTCYGFGPVARVRRARRLT